MYGKCTSSSYINAATRGTRRKMCQTERVESSELLAEELGYSLGQTGRGEKRLILWWIRTHNFRFGSERNDQWAPESTTLQHF